MMFKIITFMGSQSIDNNMVINALYTVISSINSTLKGINNDRNATNVINELEKLDLNHYVFVLKTFIDENKHNCNSISIAIAGINEILEKINYELSSINAKLYKHMNKFFYNYRILDCNVNIKNLKKYKSILHQRYDLLISIFRVSSDRLNNA